jgi:hypothetical protein
MKCTFCREKEATGEVLTTYHDGSIMSCEPACEDCGMQYDNCDTSQDDIDSFWGFRESWFTPYGYWEDEDQD